MPLSRAKGRRGELDYIRRWGGARISKLGEAGPDVVDAWGNVVEIKRLVRLPVALRKWLTQAADEGAHLVAFREDKGEWYVLMTASHFYDLSGEPPEPGGW